MLVLSRSVGQDVVMTLPDGRRVRIAVIHVDGRTARLGFEAPSDVVIHRGEVQVAVDAESAR